MEFCDIQAYINTQHTPRCNIVYGVADKQKTILFLKLNARKFDEPTSKQHYMGKKITSKALRIEEDIKQFKAEQHGNEQTEPIEDITKTQELGKPSNKKREMEQKPKLKLLTINKTMSKPSDNPPNNDDDDFDDEYLVSITDHKRAQVRRPKLVPNRSTDSDIIDDNKEKMDQHHEQKPKLKKIKQEK